MIIKKFPMSRLFTDLILPPLPTSILCCISIYILFKDKVDIKDITKYFFISFIIGVVLQTGSYSIVLPIFIIIVIVELKNSKNTNCTIEALIVIFTIYFISVMVKGFTGAKDNLLLKDYIIAYALVLVMSFFISKLKLKLKFSSLKTSGKIILIMSTPIALSILLIYPYVNSADYRIFPFVIDWYIPSVIPLFSTVFILVVIYNYEKSLKVQIGLKREIQEKYEIEEYASMVEEMYSQTRMFKHDYINMLTPLKEYIDNGDVKGLKEFFYENVIHMDQNIKWDNSNIDKLKYIKISGLKALLSTKLIKALSMNVEIKVEIVENIFNISMNTMELCRIIGILMDNAVESAVKCDDPKLYFCILSKGEYIIAAVNNNFCGEKPEVHKIYEKGFSTKGEGRGLGLYTLKKIIDEKYDNVFINTSVEGNMFIQELWIKNLFS
ncbi:sensor histidine kinase [Clostridium sp. JNZ X4-2]